VGEWKRYVVLIESAGSNNSLSVRVSLLDGTDGRVLKGPVEVGRGQMADVAMTTGAVYVATDRGELICMDPVAGKVVWRQQVPFTRGQWCRVLASDESVVYLARGLAIAFSSGGEHLWEQLLPEGVSGHPMLAQIEGGVLLTAGNNGIACIDSRSGSVVWTNLHGEGIRQLGSSASEGLCVVGTAGKLIALSLADGTRRWTRHIGDSGPPSSLAQVVIVRQWAFLYPMERDRQWRLHGYATADGQDELRDAEPFKVGMPLLSNDRFLVAFDVQAVRCYVVPEIPG